MKSSSAISLPAALNGNFARAADVASFFRDQAENYRQMSAKIPATRLFPAELKQLRANLQELAQTYDEIADVLESTTANTSPPHEAEEDSQ